VTGFLAPKRLDDLFAGQPVAQMLMSTADVILVVDAQGAIVDAASNVAALPAGSIIGRRFTETLALDSRTKAVDMLAASIEPNRRFELNHRLSSGLDLAVAYTVFRTSTSGPRVFSGRDLSSVAALQQRLVEAQRLADDQFLKVRSADARYRILFHLSSEAIVILDSTSLKIQDLNPAASDLFDATPGRLVGKRLIDVFGAEGAGELEQQLQSVRVAGRLEAARARLADGRTCWLAAALFRDGDSSQILLRVSPSGSASDVAAPLKAKSLRLLDEMPDAFVVLDAERRVIDANSAFLELVDLASLAQARGQVIDRWLGRTNVESEILFNNMREHRCVRAFLSSIRSEHGLIEDVAISGVSTLDGDEVFHGLTVRAEPRRGQGALLPPETSRSAEELAELVGRVPLKELVRETTEITERLCIEASLRLTGDNRAAAAQMLGLSRQGLYDKLRRYDMIDGSHDP
jgi:transcriptional regulator PpsR